jgi:hypothetical protein
MRSSRHRDPASELALLHCNNRRIAPASALAMRESPGVPHDRDLCFESGTAVGVRGLGRRRLCPGGSRLDNRRPGCWPHWRAHDKRYDRLLRIDCIGVPPRRRAVRPCIAPRGRRRASGRCSRPRLVSLLWPWRDGALGSAAKAFQDVAELHPARRRRGQGLGQALNGPVQALPALVHGVARQLLGARIGSSVGLQGALQLGAGPLQRGDPTRSLVGQRRLCLGPVTVVCQRQHPPRREPRRGRRRNVGYQLSPASARIRAA